MPIIGTPKSLNDRSFNFAHPMFNGLACFYWGGSNTDLLTQRSGVLDDPDSNYEYVDQAIPGVTGGKALKNLNDYYSITFPAPTTPLTNDLPGTYNDFTVIYIGRAYQAGTVFSLRDSSGSKIFAFSFLGSGDPEGFASNFGFGVNDGTSSNVLYVGEGLVKGELATSAFKRQGNTNSILKNGVFRESTTTTVGALPITHAIVGRRQESPWDGNRAVLQTSLFVVWKRALSNAEILEFHNNPFVFLPDPGGAVVPPPVSPYRKTKKVYHIGNSVTDTINYSKLQTIARANLVDYIYGRHIIPGAPLEWLRANPTSGFMELPYGFPGNALPNYDWDVLTLQPFDRGVDDDIRDSTYFMGLMYGRTSNLNAKTLIYSRWTRQQETFPGSGVNEPYNFPLYWARSTSVSNESKAYFEAVLLGVRAANPNRAVFLAPVGDAMLMFDTEARAGRIPGFTQVLGLFADGIHLTDIGAYLVGCVFYSCIYEEDPAPLAFTNYTGVTTELADKLQDIAWKTVDKHPYSGVDSSVTPPTPPPTPPPVIPPIEVNPSGVRSVGVTLVENPNSTYTI